MKTVVNVSTGEIKSVPLTAEEVAASTPTPAEIQAQVIALAQKRLDDFAQSRGYDNIISLCTYATDPLPAYAAEGQAGIDARSKMWEALRGILGDVMAGKRHMPMDWGVLEKELPVLKWPSTR